MVHAEGMYGMFMVVKGDISVINAQNQKVAAKVGSKILPGETVVSGKDSRAKIVMSDRNVMNISPDTTLKIEKYTNDPKTGEKNVELNLIDGKARNNVEQKYDGEKSKFIMKTATAVAGVRGTQFFVAYNSKSQTTQVVTLKGQVTFAPVSVDGSVGKAVTVNKGESTSVAAGAVAPEPPKAMPKEELNKVDKESTAATNTPPKEQGPASADGNKSSDQKKDADAKTDGNTAPQGGSEATNKQDGNAPKESASNGKREPASQDPNAPKEGGSAPKESAGRGSGDSGTAPAAGDGKGTTAPKNGSATTRAGTPNSSPGSTPTAPRMVTGSDMNMNDLVKNITPPTMVVAPPPPPMFNMPPPLAPPPPPPAIGDIIKNYNGTTKVIIVPQ